MAMFGFGDKGEIPAGIQMMIANLIKNAAPQLAEQIDGIGNLVRDFKLQLDRIEARQIVLENLLTGNDNGQPRISEPRRNDALGGNPGSPDIT